MKIAIVAAPEAGQEAIARFIPSPIITVTKTWVTHLAQIITEKPGYVDTPSFERDLKSTKAAMSGYDKIFYVPIYPWNIVDDKNEEYRILLDYNIVKIINTVGLEVETVPEAPAWERAEFIRNVVE